MKLFDLTTANPIKISDWNDFIARSKRASIFHSQEWAEVLSRSFNYKPCYLISKVQTDPFALIPLMEVQSLLKGKIGVSLPFSDIVDPILPDGVVDPAPLFKSAVQYAKRHNWKYIDFHGGENLFATATPAREFYGHRLDLSEDLDGIFNAFSRITRKNVRKAVKHGVHVYTENSLKSLDKFYTLHCETRKRLELPPQPHHFFRNIYKYIILNKMGDALFASYNGKTIACGIFIHFRGRAFFEFGVSTKKYPQVKANNLLLWEAIKRYAEQGYKEICFGRTDLLNEGLRHFKLRWGVIEYPIKYFRYDMINERMVTMDTSRFYKMIKLCFGNMPISASKIITRLLYRSFG